MEHLQLLVLPLLQAALDAGDTELLDAALVERLLRDVSVSDGRMTHALLCRVGAGAVSVSCRACAFDESRNALWGRGPAAATQPPTNPCCPKPVD